MTDINRLITSLKRRSAHVKEFGDDITFVKLEDLDALVEAVELARNKAADWEEKAAINYAERTAMIQHITELESRTFTLKLPPLNDDLISILGRPNFMCAHLAELLRKSGTDIKRKSEHEQAAIIHWFLGIYLEHGDKWEGIAKSDIQARAAGIKVEDE